MFLPWTTVDRMKPFVRVLHPVLFQGVRAAGRYFEGWYFKQTSPGIGSEPARSLAFIPGITRSASGYSSFVQFIDGKTGATRYFGFSGEEFSYSDDPFEVRVGGNRFGFSGIHVELHDSDLEVRAKLAYGEPTPIRTSILWPGIMGPYSFVPFMECYHGIGSLDHDVTGTVSLHYGSAPDPERILFDGGRGYIEKDWGRSMPSAWIWMQTNTFSPGAGLPCTTVPSCLSGLTSGRQSFFLSIARIPWLGSHFNGFLCVLYVNGTEYRFSTYTGATIRMLECDGAEIRVLLADRLHTLEVHARRNHEGTLAAPIQGAMERRISESADSCLHLVFREHDGDADTVRYTMESGSAAVEVVGPVETLHKRR